MAGVVDPVAGHRHDFAAGLQGADEAQFLFRFNAGKDVDAVGSLGQCSIVERGQFAASQGALGVQADLAGDGQRRDGVVAGDHLDPDAGRMAVADGSRRCLARRVDHADDADQGQCFNAFRGQPKILPKIEIFARQQQHAHALLGIGLRCFFDDAEVDGRRDTLCTQLIDAQRQQSFERAFDVDDVIAITAMGRGHELPAGVKGQDIDTREARSQRMFIQFSLAGGYDQRRFGGVTGDLPLTVLMTQ